MEYDCDGPGSYEEAIAGGWTEITYEPKGMREKFFGYCPEHRPSAMDSLKDQPSGEEP